MLYLTTRSATDAFTANRALTQDCGPDGGLYIPFRMPSFNQQELQSILECDDCSIIAQILNLFFTSKLNTWDVEFCVGKNPLRIQTPFRKSLVAEAWHNPGNEYIYAVASLNNRLNNLSNAPLKSWTRIAVGIAYAFCIYAKAIRENIIHSEETFDVCVLDGDLSLPAAMVYAKQMGLPIENVIICSHENSAIWDLINHGQLTTGLLNATQKQEMERFIYCLLGSEQAAAYQSACERRGMYVVPEEMADVLHGFLFASVVSNERVSSVSENVLKVSGYDLSPNAAVCYAGIQDYRSKTGQGSRVFLFSTTPQKA